MLSYDSKMYPILVHLGPVTIYSYGVMMALGFLGASWVLGRGLHYQRQDAELSTRLVLWAAIGGLLGARLLFIFANWTDFLYAPASFVFTGAGFVWHGGLIGGTVGVSLCIRQNSLNWAKTMDAVAPAIAFGHGLGRVGCHLAGDGDWGPPTDLPWGVAYTDALIGWPYAQNVLVHPTPMYEMLFYFLVAAILWMRRTAAHRPGSLFWAYLLLAGVGRFFLEFVRLNPPVLWGLSRAQIISSMMVVFGAMLLIFQRTGVPPQARTKERIT